MHTRWTSLPLLATCVSAFYPYHQDSETKNKRFYPLAPERPSDDQDVYTIDVRRVRRQNAFNIVESTDPTQPHSLAVHQDGQDYSYLSTLGFGSKGQEMHMLIDTGSTNTWVFGSDCKSAACSIHNTFGKDDSSTLTTNSKTFQLAYGTGEVDGVMAQDKVVFANYSLQLSFGLAQTASNDFNNYPMDGILGLGPASSNDLGSKTVMQTLDEQAGLPSNILGIHLQRAKDGSKDGTITIGGLDNSKFKGDIAYTNIKAGSSWEIVVDDVFVGGQACKFSGKSAIIDTGTSYALMPPGDAKVLHALIPGSSSSGEAYTVPCDASTTVEVSFSKVKYSISPKDYVGKQGSGNVCASNIIGHQPFGPDQWILGDIFLKNVYSVFDFDKDRIGEQHTLSYLIVANVYRLRNNVRDHLEHGQHNVLIKYSGAL
jgi:cathepsin D